MKYFKVSRRADFLLVLASIMLLGCVSGPHQVFVGPYYQPAQSLKGAEASFLVHRPIFLGDLSGIHLRYGPVIGGGFGRDYDEVYLEGETGLSACFHIFCGGAFFGAGKIHRSFDDGDFLSNEYTISGYLGLPVLFYSRSISSPRRMMEHGIMLKYWLIR